MTESTMPTPAAPPAPTAAPVSENRTRGHSPARDTYEQIRHTQDQAPGKAPAPPAADQQQAPPAARDRVAVGKFDVSENELAAMLDRQAKHDLRQTQVPNSPADYKIQMDVPLPPGVDSGLIFDQADPAAAATLNSAREWAHGKGLSQAEFSELLAVYANGKAAEMSIINRAAAAEREKMGPMGGARIDALSQWIRSQVGDADARIVVTGLATAAQVNFLEKVMTKLSNQGAASFSQQHRVAPDAKEIPGYEGMSFEQRRYAQDQAAARGRR